MATDFGATKCLETRGPPNHLPLDWVKRPDGHHVSQKKKKKTMSWPPDHPSQFSEGWPVDYQVSKQGGKINDLVATRFPREIIYE